MSLEALAGLCCDVQPVVDKSSPTISEKNGNEAILTRVPLSRNASNINSNSNDESVAFPFFMSRQTSLSDDKVLVGPPLLARQLSNSRYSKVFFSSIRKIVIVNIN